MGPFRDIYLKKNPFFKSLTNKIKLYLFGQLFFAKFVEGEELPGQGDVFQESAAGKFHSNNDLTIRNHHGDVTELNLILQKNTVKI